MYLLIVRGYLFFLDSILNKRLEENDAGEDLMRKWGLAVANCYARSSFTI